MAVTPFPGATDPEVRELIEQTVPWHIRAALPDLLPLYGVRVAERWPHHPDLGPFLEYTALRVLKARGERRGLSHTAALREACERLRMNPEAVRKQFRRSQKRYLHAVAAGWDTTSQKPENPPLRSISR